MSRQLTIKYSLLQSSYWLVAATAMAYITPILEAKGFSSMEIGILNGIRYGSVIVFQTMIGSYSDRHVSSTSLKRTIACLSGISVLVAGVFWYAPASFLLAVIIFLIFGSSINCVLPLIESMSIQYMNGGQELNYAASRACGSGVWAIACVGLGVISDAIGAQHILLLQIAATLLMILIDLCMDPVKWTGKPKVAAPMPKQAAEEGGKVHGTLELLRRYPKYVMFLIACMLLFAAYNMNFTFMIDVIHELGGSHTDYGIVQFVIAVAEIPVAVYFYQLRKKLSIQKLMVICGIFATLRTAATAFAPSILLLIAAQTLEVFGLAIYYAGSIFFVMEYLPPQDSVKGTSLINLAAVGIGEAGASLVSGWVCSTLGLQALMNISVAVSLAGAVMMCLMVRCPAEHPRTCITRKQPEAEALQ